MAANQRHFPSGQEERQASHEVHHCLHLASARVDNGDYSRIVAPAGYCPAPPCTTPHSCPNHDRQQLFNCDVDISPTIRQFQLEPEPIRGVSHEPEASEVICTSGVLGTTLDSLHTPFQMGRKQIHHLRSDLNSRFRRTL